jgi:hypothetical protein
MTHYLYEVRTSQTTKLFTNRQSAIRAARQAAKAGRMADVWKMLSNPEGKPVVNLGRIHVCFPKTA